jgi:hypothetical protein
MDDIEQVRLLLAEPPPDAAALERGRARLAAASAKAGTTACGPAGRSAGRPAGESAGRSAGGSPGGGRRPWYRLPVRRTVLAGGTAAAVVGVVAAVVAGGGGAGGGAAVSSPAPTTTAATGGASTTLSGRTVLLAAAKTAAGQPAATSRYWHVSTLSVAPVTVGAPGARYVVERRQVYETWIPRDPHAPAWAAFREVGARPRTAADAKAWRAAGSPSSWDLGPSDTADGHHLIITTAPSRGRLSTFDDPGSSRYLVGDRMLTAAEVQDLPADPAALKALLLAPVRDDGGTTTPEQALPGRLVALLQAVPAPPDVRAAAFRVLAGLPEVSNLGPGRDSRGRAGVTLRIPGPQDSDVTFVVDPRTSTLLSVRANLSGAAVKSSAVLDAGWTDGGPRVPAVP